MTVKDLYFFLIILITYLTAAGLVQSVERLTAERDRSRGFDSRGWTNTRGLRLFTVPYFFVRSFRYTASYRHGDCTEGAGVGDCSAGAPPK